MGGGECIHIVVTATQMMAERLGFCKIFLLSSSIHIDYKIMASLRGETSLFTCDVLYAIPLLLDKGFEFLTTFRCLLFWPMKIQEVREVERRSELETCQLCLLASSSKRGQKLIHKIVNTHSSVKERK